MEQPLCSFRRAALSLKATRILFCAVFSILLSASVQATPIISVSSTTANIDDIVDWVSVNVSIEDVTDLYAYQFGIAFDPLIVHVFDVVEGNFLSSAGPTFFIPGVFDNTAGQITFSANTLLGPIPGASGGGLLFTILFTAVGPGITVVTPTVNPLSGVGLLNSGLLPIEPFAVSAGTITLEPSASVPEPATLILVGIGLGSIALTRKARSCSARQSATSSTKQ